MNLYSILNIASNYDLVIAIAHDQPSLEDLFLGSVSKRIMAISPISLVVVRNPKAKIEKILVPTSGLSNMLSAVEMCAAIAKRNNTKVTLLHVTNAIPLMDYGLDWINESLADILKTDLSIARNIRAQGAELRSFLIKTQIELRHGLPIEGNF